MIFKRLFAKKSVAVSGKSFLGDLEFFADKIRTTENFSLVRFGDGELKIIAGQETDYSHKKYAEHTYHPDDIDGERQRMLLTKSLSFQNPQYYVGITCPCCVGEQLFFELKDQSGQQESQLTWANVFVNSNFPHFKHKVVPLFKRRDVYLIANEHAATSHRLPFDVEQFFKVGENAWINDHQRLYDEISDYIQSNNVHDSVFLFCSGVLSNILIYQLNSLYPDNTYIDAGSVFDVELGMGKTRKYLRRGKTLRKTCIWAK